jgi:hypothetical protein
VLILLVQVARQIHVFVCTFVTGASTAYNERFRKIAAVPRVDKFFYFRGGVLALKKHEAATSRSRYYVKRKWWTTQTEKTESQCERPF